MSSHLLWVVGQDQTSNLTLDIWTNYRKLRQDTVTLWRKTSKNRISKRPVRDRGNEKMGDQCHIKVNKIPYQCLKVYDAKTVFFMMYWITSSSLTDYGGGDTIAGSNDRMYVCCTKSQNCNVKPKKKKKNNNNKLSYFTPKCPKVTSLHHLPSWHIHCIWSH